MLFGKGRVLLRLSAMEVEEAELGVYIIKSNEYKTNLTLTQCS